MVDDQTFCNMLKDNYTILVDKDTSLFCQSWQPDEDIMAVLFIVHGLGEHSGRYEELAGHFTKNKKKRKKRRKKERKRAKKKTTKKRKKK